MRHPGRHRPFRVSVPVEQARRRRDPGRRRGSGRVRGRRPGQRRPGLVGSTPPDQHPVLEERDRHPDHQGGVPMRVRRFSLIRVRHEEDGAVLAIVAISLICLIGMLVLTFDLGRGVALKRNMVNGADAAALAAAMECAQARGEVTARQEAAELLADNNGAATILPGTAGFRINPGPAQCDGVPSPDPENNPTVTVTVSVPQQYFFAPIFGINNGTVVATATAEWTAGDSNPAPLRVDQLKIDECVEKGVPDPEGRVDCYFTFEGTGGQWGWLNLPEGWPIKGQDPNPMAKCPATGGTDDLVEYIGGMGGMGSPGSPTL